MNKAETELRYPRRTSRRKKTRAAIVAAADRLFRERGYKETTMNAIAEAADVHVTTVFNHFPAKADLVAKIAHVPVAALEKEIEAHKGKTPFFSFMRDAIRKGGAYIGQKQVNAMRADVGIFLGEEPTVMAVWVIAEVQKARMLAGYIAEEYGLDLATDQRPSLVANMIIAGTVESFQRWQESGGETDLVADSLAVVDAVEHLLEQGLGAKQPA